MPLWEIPYSFYIFPVKMVWMNLENVILSKLTQEQKMQHRIFSLIGGWRKMRTHGPMEGSTKHWGLLGGKGEGQWEGEVGRDTLGTNAKCGWRGERKQNTLPCVYLCNYLACSAHVPQSLKCNKKLKKKRKYVVIILGAGTNVLLCYLSKVICCL